MKLLWLALTLTLALVAGCGGDTAEKNDYVEAVNKAQTDFAASMSKVQQGTGPAAGEQLFTDMKGSIDKVVTDLKAVEPPDDVATLHDQLVKQLGDFGAAVEKAAGSLTSSDPQKLASAQADFARSASGVGTDISRTISEINAKLQE